MVIRWATREDILAFYGRDVPYTVRALAAEKNGEIVGIGGFYFDGDAAVAFSDVRASAMSKREFVRGARAVKDLLHEVKVDVVAKAGPSGDIALRHFGFEGTGMVYRMARDDRT